MIYAAHSIANSLRVLTVSLTLAAMVMFPISQLGNAKSWREIGIRWYAIAGCELLFFVAIASILDHWNQAIVWYRTPILLLSAIFFLVFEFKSWRNSWKGYRSNHPHVKL
jgi:hypothetical protein